MAALAISLGGLAVLWLTSSAAAVTTETMNLKGSHGYKLQVHAASYQSCGCKYRFGLRATKGRDGVERSGDYEIEGKDGKHLVGDFGKFGIVDVRFHPRKKLRPVHECSGAEVRTTRGVWKGRVKFKGEHRYTSASAHRARGSISHVLRPWLCHRPSRAAGDAELLGDRYLKQSHIYLGASDGYGASGATIHSGIERAFGAHGSKVYSQRDVEVKAPVSAFTVSSDLSTAHLAPPSPFAGAADFARGVDPQPDSWTGTLDVQLPGQRNRTPLTGEGFDVRLYGG
jgi:hypothetical protein